MRNLEIFIEQLNKTLKVAMDNGGDAGGNYYSYRQEMFDEVVKLVELLDEPSLRVVWNDTMFAEYPVVIIQEKE